MHERVAFETRAEPSGNEPLYDDGGVDWEALKVGGRLHLYCYLRDSVLALASLDAVA